MKWRTPVEIDKTAFSISHHDKILTLGSCFAVNIGQRLNASKFDTLTNPFGIVYNATSIDRQIQGAVNDVEISEDSLLLTADGQYVHYDYHSDLRAGTIAGWKHLYKERSYLLADRLRQASVVIVTLGTSFVYQLHDGHVVANCHKQPRRLFERRLLSIDEIMGSILKIRDSLHEECQLILTVSPVRHIRDTVVGNTRSKARLLEAAHLAVESSSKITYFPAYEIVMDELRDYRYYEDDLIHIRQSAIDYIWSAFAASHFSTETMEALERIRKINSAVAHRPRNIHGDAYQAFCSNQVEYLEDTIAMYPHLKLDEEMRFFADKIIDQ